MSEEIRESCEPFFKKAFNVFMFGLPILCGICWIMGVPLQLGLAVLSGNYLALLIGFSVAAAFIYWPYGDKLKFIDYLIVFITKDDLTKKGGLMTLIRFTLIPIKIIVVIYIMMLRPNHYCNSTPCIRT